MFSAKSKSCLAVLPLLLLRVAFTVALALVFTGVVGTHAEAATRLPDLIVSAASIPSTASSGTTIGISATIKNKGNATSSAFSVSYYGSTSASSIAGAVLLGVQDIASLRASASITLVTSLAIPPSAPSGTFYLVVVADSGNAVRESNESNNIGSSGAIVVTNLTPPTISGVNATQITASNATITWTTDKTSTSQADYGTTAAYGSSTSPDSSLVTSHAVTLSGLTAGKAYHFQVQSRDAAGNVALSSDYTFTTSAPTAGNTYYVATNGNDGNPGTETQPFLTIQKAADVVNPGDTVIVKDGTYVSSQSSGYGPVVHISRGGNSTNWVTFQSANPLGAKIDGQNNAIEVGWWVDASYVRIQGFEMLNLSKTAFEAWSMPHIQIVGNAIHNIGRICTNTTVGFSGAYLSPGTSDWSFDSNIFHNIGRLDSSEGCGLTAYLFNDHGLYLAGVDSITIANNIFYNILRGWPVQLYNGDTSQGASNIKILNNTFAFPAPYSSGGHIMLASPSVTDSLIANNIFYQPKNNAAIVYWSVTPSNVQVQNNLTYQGTITASPPIGISFSGNLDNTNPQFVSPSTNNFDLLSTSPAIDAGVSTAPTVTTDFNGIARPQGAAYDIGAFEFIY